MELILMILLAIVSAGVVGMIIKYLMGVVTKVVEKSENKLDDAILAAAKPQLDVLSAMLEAKVEEMLKAKIAELKAAEAAKDEAIKAADPAKKELDE